MRHLRIIVVTAVVAWPLAATAEAQTLLERLGGVLRTPAEATSPQPDAASGYLGLTADEVDGTVVVVVEPRPDSPAAQAGFAPGDVVVAIDGEAVATLDEMGDRLANQPAGKKLTFDVLRDGQRQSIEVTLGQRPGQTQAPALNPATDSAPARTPVRVPPEPMPDIAANELPSPRPAAPPRLAPGIAASRPTLGVSVVDLTENLRRQFGVTVTRGAVVTAVANGSPAEQAGIPVGAVIVAADGARINGYDDLVRHVAARRGGDAIELSYFLGPQLTRRMVRLGGDAGLAPEDQFRLVDEPGLRLRDDGRPAARILGRVLENLAPGIAPGIGQGVAPGVAPGVEAPGVGASVADVYEMRRQMQLMQAQIDQLQQRVAELERLLTEPEPVE